ncbi:MAG: excinuclease ABC subunit UvrC [Candidatus Schekmanbacteria bacterium]|nr:excinuclease ABC subunit UvrC [Candidatus Schekmanbacteria bacterium]
MALLDDRLATLPRCPGVYLFLDRGGSVLYVGKAANLRARVRSYFHSPEQLSEKTRSLVQHIADLEIITTDDELAALALESNLIKEKRPRFNIILRDDKQYPYVQLTASHAFPRINVVRRVEKDGNQYFGPFLSASALRATLRLIHAIVPIRQCSDGIFATVKRPCLYFQIGQCEAPCARLQSAEGYAEHVAVARELLAGRTAAVVKMLESRMTEAAEALAFERAAEFRDKLLLLQSFSERQDMISVQQEDADIVGLVQADTKAWVVEVFHVRQGRVVGRYRSRVSDREGGGTRSEVTGAFVEQYYRTGRFVPPEVVLRERPQSAELLEAWLTQKRGGKVVLHVPQRGRKVRLLRLVEENLAMKAELGGGEAPESEEVLLELREILELDRVPYRIECFDVSTFQGASPVGSMVVFEGGRPKREDYRRFRIQHVEGVDDYEMMREIVGRRYRRLREEGGPPPDLILIDGGAGHLAAACAVLAEEAIEAVDVLSIAKDRARGSGSERMRTGERIFKPGVEAARVLAADESSESALRLLQRVRDEAHRFAITYHRKLRGDTSLRSALRQIPGVGPKRCQALLTHLGSAGAVQVASVDELRAVPGIDRPTAERIHGFFHAARVSQD